MLPLIGGHGNVSRSDLTLLWNMVPSGYGLNPCVSISWIWGCCHPEDTNLTSKLKKRGPNRKSGEVATKVLRKGKNQVTLGRYPLMESQMV